MDPIGPNHAGMTPAQRPVYETTSQHPDGHSADSPALHRTLGDAIRAIIAHAQAGEPWQLWDRAAHECIAHSGDAAST